MKSRVYDCKSATRAIKNLYQTNVHEKAHRAIAKQAFEIFHSIDEGKNHFVINTMIAVCLKTKHSHELWSIWHDIDAQLGCPDLSYPSLLRCCVECNQFERGKHVHSRIPLQVSQNNGYVQNALINMYSHFGDLQHAVDVFDAIPVSNRCNANTISAMLKAYSSHECHQQTLSLYTQYATHIVMNDICRLFVLKSCMALNDFAYGQHIIDGLDFANGNCHRFDTKLLNKTISFYGHFNQLSNALSLFHEMRKKTSVTISSMMQAFIQNAEWTHALQIYRDENYHRLRDDVSHLLAVKCCTNLPNQAFGESIIARTLAHTTNVRYLHTVLHFYNQFKMLPDAESVFDAIPTKSEYSVNLLMAAYYEHAMAPNAVQLFTKYVVHGQVTPNQVTHMLAIKSFGACGEVANAAKLFGAITEKSNIIVHAMMTAYTDNQRFDDALAVYESFDACHDDICHLLAVKACIGVNDVRVAQRVLSHIARRKDGDENSVELDNTLVTGYGHFGQVEQAQKVFDGIRHKTDVSVNNLMHTLIHNGLYERALHIFDAYQTTRLVDGVSVLLALKCCTHTNDRGKGLQIIDENLTAVNYDIQRHTELQNTLIHFYGCFNDVTQSAQIFHAARHKTMQTINAMMTAYLENGMIAECIQLYAQIGSTQYASLRATEITHLLAIKAYSSLGDVASAQLIFDGMPQKQKNIQSLNCMMTAYVNNKQHERALALYDEISAQQKSEVSHILALKACTGTGNSRVADRIIEGLQNNIESLSVELKCTLIDYYGNNGDIGRAERIFEHVDDDRRDHISINAMMTAYVENGCNQQCIELFKQYYERLQSEYVSHVLLFKACCNSSCYHYGHKIHTRMQDSPHHAMLDISSIQINLIHFYGKCGKLHLCQQIFDAVHCSDDPQRYCRDVEVWNAIIHAFGRNGDLAKAKQLFDVMQNQVGLVADDKVYTSVINACSHSGDVAFAQHVWHTYVAPKQSFTATNINALIDCYARNGALSDAYALAVGTDDALIPYSVWMSLMNGCRKYQQKEMGERVFAAMKDRLDSTRYRDKLGAASVLMSHIYSACGEFDKVEQIRHEMKRNGWTKMKGISEVDINGVLYRFEAGNRYKKDFCGDFKRMDEKLNGLSYQMKEHGFEHDFSFITKELNSDHEREYALMRHSEKLALVYALLHTSKEYQIVINKNLRICNDCHSAIKLISLIEARTFVISDANRVHTFYDGLCSCNDVY